MANAPSVRFSACVTIKAIKSSITWGFRYSATIRYQGINHAVQPGTKPCSPNCYALRQEKQRSSGSYLSEGSRAAAADTARLWSSYTHHCKPWVFVTSVLLGALVFTQEHVEGRDLIFQFSPAMK